MTLTNPIFLLPIVIPTTHDGAGEAVKLNTTTDVTLPAGTYYWSPTGASGSFQDMLVTALNAAMAGTWTVTLSTTTWHLSISYTGASTPTNLTFVDLDVLAPWMFGSTSNKATATITFTAKAWAGTMQPRWLWRPDEYVIDDQIRPRATTVVAMSPFDGSATIDNYGEWAERTLRMEAVPGARVYQWAIDDSVFAAAAGETQGDPNLALESFWRDCRTFGSTPPSIRYLPAGESAWATWGYAVVQWVDAGQLSDLATVAADLTTEPLRYTVTMRLLDTGAEGAA